MKNKLLMLLGCLLLAATARAQVSVTAPWVRATVAAQKSTGAYMHLLSTGGARLVGVSSPVAAKVELHQMEMKNEMMTMRQVDGIDLPPGKGVNLAGGSYHIMLMGLKRQLKQGDAVEITLQLQGKDNKRENVTVKVPVKPLGFVSPAVPVHH
jgi:copper(I)-binding protein